MRCDQIVPYLPGLAGGDLRPETARLVESHVSTCRSCSADTETLRRVTGGLTALGAREIEPPAYLVDSILESVHERRRRVIPILPPQVPADLIRVVQENRETIASAAGALVIAAGAAYALWRAVRARPAGEPAATA